MATLKEQFPHIYGENWDTILKRDFDDAVNFLKVMRDVAKLRFDGSSGLVFQVTVCNTVMPRFIIIFWVFVESAHFLCTGGHGQPTDD